MYKESVKSYFKEKAEEYDLTDEQMYWVLSDELLWHIFQEEVLHKIGDSVNFVDAGAGTGRWSKKILDNYVKSKGLLLDLSKEMLAQAENKLQKDGTADRVIIKNVDLDIYDESDEIEKYDLAYSFHNVLGFVNEPKNVIGKMSNMVKKGGYVVCGVPNYYHNIYFGISTGNVELADKCVKTHRGQFTLDMPEMNMFTPEYLKKIYLELGINVEGVYGFPVAIYPGMQETQLHGETKKLVSILSSNENYEKILEIEKKLYKCEEAASRGNQLLIIGKRK